MPATSVLTIAAGRAAHLANLVRGLARQTEPPAELIVARMQFEPYRDLPAAPFPVRQVPVAAPEDGQGMPLALARNTAGAAAAGDLLVFLDADCIPDPGLVADYRSAAAAAEGVLMGDVLYLPEGAAGEMDFDRFAALGQRHEDRRGPPAGLLDPCGDHRCFWSLNFALSRAVWEASGGFDPRFRGYGGEDTDFGRTLRHRGLDLWWARGARAYHQYHPHTMPPVRHVDSILRNTEVFAAKWGERTMQHWLRAFRLMGLIDEGPGGLRRIRAVTEADIAACRPAPGRAYASSLRVLERLESRGARATA